MLSRGPSSDGSIFVLFRQEDKDFHQVKSWPPAQQLVIKSIISNFVLHGKGAAGCSIGFRKLVLDWVVVIGFAGSTSDWLVMLNFTTLVFLSSVRLLLALGLFILCSFLWEHVPILVSGYWLPPSLYIYFVFCSLFL